MDLQADPSEKSRKAEAWAGAKAKLEARLAARSGPSGAVMSFKSHNEGNNAVVTVWPDRIDWDENRGAGAGRTTARWSAAFATGGLSLLKTGLGGRDRSSNSIPIRMIQGVTTQRKGLRFTVVRVATAGDAIEFHVTRADADRIKTCILAQMSAAAGVTAIASAPNTVSLGDDLAKLAGLRDSGVLSQGEFDAAKARLLA